MIRTALCTLALTLAAHGAEKSAWSFAAKPSGQRVAFANVRGTCEAILAFSRANDAARKPVKKNNVTTPPLAVELWLADTKQAGKFDFNDFEGPDAVSGSTKLVTVTLTTKGKPWVRKWTASGWFSPLRDPVSGAHRAEGEPEVFVFGLGDVLRDYRDLVQLADSLAAGADAFTIEIAGAKKGAAGLRFDVPLAGAGDAMKQLLATKQ